MEKGGDKSRRKAKKNEANRPKQFIVRAAKRSSDGDPDAEVSSPRKPKPTPRSGAMAMPEPSGAEYVVAEMAPRRNLKN